MSSVVLSDEFFAKIAGWDVLKQARGALASGKVLSSEWNAPVLRGVVTEGSTSYRCGLVVKDAIDIENLCTCRNSRSWGTICAHSVAVGLHHLRSTQPLALAPSASTASQTPKPAAKAVPYQRVKRAGAGEGGVEAALHVIFPPNFHQALGRGKVMLYFEAAWEKGRTPLNALPGSESFSFEPEDGPVIDALESIAGDTPGMVQLNHAELASVLSKLKGHPRVTLGKSQALEVMTDPAPLEFKADLLNSGEIELELRTKLPADGLIKGDGFWLAERERLQPVQLPQAARALLTGPVRIARAQVPFFLSQDWPALTAHARIEANFRPEDFEVTAGAPGIHLELGGGLANLQARLRFEYGGKMLDADGGSQSDGLWLPDPANPKRYLTRNLEAEQQAKARLLRAGFTGPHPEGHFQLAGQNAVLAFFAREYYRLEREWVVTLDERLERSTEKNLERIEPKFEITPSGEQWFDLGVSYATGGGERFSPAEIQRLILSGQSHTKLKNGKFAIIDTGAVEELQEVLLDCAPRQHEKGYRIQSTQAGFLASALAETPGWKVQAPEKWRAKAAQHRGDLELEVPPLGQLEAVLRPYQKQGVAWMEFLRQSAFGGILADEMGLGKTLQTLAHLQSVVARSAASERKPWLVVCPTSLVFNWVAEAGKFTPELRVLALHGAKRQELFQKVTECDLVVTSYALIRRDLESYLAHEFDTVVLDEAQHIKNRQTQNAQAVKAIRSRLRLVLTGTPIENSVLDLWSIFDFLMPGYLGPAADFKERYEVPIVKEQDAGAQARLARRIRPFLLRRLKRDVARDLPEKIEQVSFCELSGDQQEVYQQLLQSTRQEVLSAVGGQGLQKSRMVILTALLRLRQACCDLRLLKLANVPASSSGKVEMFQELLQEVLDGGHRVLVFSQFVEMLQLLRESLEAQEIRYSYLDGSTSDRGKVVQEFQNDSGIPVFLISLKAGGVGLNLASADTVIHFDPWWNPAVEAQATDRAHRIGQTRVVTSYKLITRGTVEEKILNLQQRKKELVAATLSGEEEFTGALSWEEIQGLLE